MDEKQQIEAADDLQDALASMMAVEPSPSSRRAFGSESLETPTFDRGGSFLWFFQVLRRLLSWCSASC